MAASIIPTVASPVEDLERARVRDGFHVYEECLQAVTWHFRDGGMSTREARALAHSVLDLNATRWISVRGEVRRDERAAASDLAKFRARVEAFTATYAG